MSETKQKALDKMLEEMNQPHSDTEDYIHNWLCTQEDDELFECILKEGKSINDALNYLTQKAKAGSKNSKAAVMSDIEGFKIIVDYFKGNETTVQSYGVVSNKPITVKDETQIVHQAIAKAKEKKKVKNEDSPLMSMFDFGVDEPVISKGIEDVDEYDEEDENDE